MAILTELNLLGQQRLDVPHVRLIEAGVRGDFDALAGKMLGDKVPLVLSGFKLTNASVGSAANQIQLIVANGSLINYNATESGSILSIPSDRANEVLSGSNANVSGGFTSNAINYIGVDFTRSADSSTTDTVQFLNASSLQESPREVPLRRTLNYKIVISTTDFTSQPNLVPLAKVQTDAANNIVTIEDVRPIMFRLGSGGDVANNQSSYSWPGGRYENTSGDIFTNGDKEIGAMKPWMDAVMTRLWELGGGEYWYSATADRNVQLVWSGSAFSNGENFEWVGTPPNLNLHWQGLRIVFDNSTGYYNDIADQLTNLADLTDLADGDCIYVDLDRTQNLTGLSALVAQKGDISTIGPGSPPGSRWVLARRIGDDIFTTGWKYPVGSWIAVATASSNGIVKLSRAASTPSTPVVISDTGGTINGPTGVVALTVNGFDGGTTGYDGFIATGGNVTTGATMAGHAITATGGAQTGTGAGGIAGIFTGGSSVASTGGRGIYSTGGSGASASWFGGDGAWLIGGANTTLPGNGVWGFGSNMTGTSTGTNNHTGKGIGGVFFGGNSTFNGAGPYGIGAFAIGGRNTIYTGTFDISTPTNPLPAPGVGVVGIGSGGFEYVFNPSDKGGDGGQFFGIGNDGTSGRTGVVGIGFFTNSAVVGGGGHFGLGGKSTSTGAAGRGGWFVGGENTSTGAGGNGILATGGNSTSGAAGHGIVATGGNSTSGTDGAGGYFTGIGGTAGAIFIPGVSALNGAEVDSTSNFGYTAEKIGYYYVNLADCNLDANSLFDHSGSNAGSVTPQGGGPAIVSGAIHVPGLVRVDQIQICIENTNVSASNVSVTVGRTYRTGATTSTEFYLTGSTETISATGSTTAWYTATIDAAYPTGFLAPDQTTNSSANGGTLWINIATSTNNVSIRGVEVRYNQRKIFATI